MKRRKKKTVKSKKELNFQNQMMNKARRKMRTMTMKISKKQMKVLELIGHFQTYLIVIL